MSDLFSGEHSDYLDGQSNVTKHGFTRRESSCSRAPRRRKKPRPRAAQAMKNISLREQAHGALRGSSAHDCTRRQGPPNARKEICQRVPSQPRPLSPPLRLPITTLQIQPPTPSSLLHLPLSRHAHHRHPPAPPDQDSGTSSAPIGITSPMHSYSSFQCLSIPLRRLQGCLHFSSNLTAC